MSNQQNDHYEETKKEAEEEKGIYFDAQKEEWGRLENYRKENKVCAITKQNYRYSLYFTINDLIDFICEHNQDGKYNHTSLEFWKWLDETMLKRYK